MIKRLFIILSLLLSINSTAQNKKSLLRTGNELYADSSYNQAEIKYRKSLEKDQDYFNASFNLADAIYKQGRYGGPDGSSSLFNALEDNAPTSENLANIYYNLGNSLFKEQKLDKAIEAYKSALRINPDDNEARHNLTIAKQQKQEQEKENQKDNKEEQEQEEQEQEEQEQEEQEQEEQKQNNQEEKEDQQNEAMSKEDAKKMLEAIQQQEKELQEELQKKKVKGKKVKVLKDW